MRLNAVVWNKLGPGVENELGTGVMNELGTGVESELGAGIEDLDLGQVSRMRYRGRAGKKRQGRGASFRDGS